MLHHQKHHQAYINAANSIFGKIEEARRTDVDFEVKAVLKELSFHIGGHILHSLFWNNLAQAGKGGGGKPSGELAKAIDDGFKNFERFKKEFFQTAISIEGSGWAALVFDRASKKILIMQIEKHNVNIYPNSEIIMVLDLWEHAYYLDYKNDRAKFIEAFWNIVNWQEAEKRFVNIKL